MHAIDITVREVTERKDKLIAELTALWEASVRATHTFLTPEGIAEIRGFVPQAFQAVGFYEHMGFKTYKRTDTDEEGRPYPLLYMRRA